MMKTKSPASDADRNKVMVEVFGPFVVLAVVFAVMVIHRLLEMTNV